MALDIRGKSKTLPDGYRMGTELKSDESSGSGQHRTHWRSVGWNVAELLLYFKHTGYGGWIFGSNTSEQHTSCATGELQYVHVPHTGKRNATSTQLQQDPLLCKRTLHTKLENGEITSTHCGRNLRPSIKFLGTRSFYCVRLSNVIIQNITSVW